MRNDISELVGKIGDSVSKEDPYENEKIFKSFFHEVRKTRVQETLQISLKESNGCFFDGVKKLLPSEKSKDFWEIQRSLSGESFKHTEAMLDQSDIMNDVLFHTERFSKSDYDPASVLAARLLTEYDYRYAEEQLAYTISEWQKSSPEIASLFDFNSYTKKAYRCFYGWSENHFLWFRC